MTKRKAGSQPQQRKKTKQSTTIECPESPQDDGENLQIETEAAVTMIVNTTSTDTTVLPSVVQTISEMESPISPDPVINQQTMDAPEEQNVPQRSPISQTEDELAKSPEPPLMMQPPTPVASLTIPPKYATRGIGRGGKKIHFQRDDDNEEPRDIHETDSETQSVFSEYMSECEEESERMLFKRRKEKVQEILECIRTTTNETVAHKILKNRIWQWPFLYCVYKYDKESLNDIDKFINQYGDTYDAWPKQFKEVVDAFCHESFHFRCFCSNSHNAGHGIRRKQRIHKVN